MRSTELFILYAATQQHSMCVIYICLSTFQGTIDTLAWAFPSSVDWDYGAGSYLILYLRGLE